MADKEKPDEEAVAEGEENAEEQPKKNRGPLKLLLGIGLLVATGGTLAMMAIPAKEKEHKFGGPFFANLGEEIVVSTPDGNGTRYVKFRSDCEYAAYEQSYFAARVADPFYLPYLKSKAQLVASSRSIEDTAIGPGREEFAAALRTKLEPIIFPVHIGKTANALDIDAKSGIRPGVSHHMATFRGRFYDHTLHVDVPAGILRLGDGPEITFRGDEDDLEVRSAIGDTVYVDVTHAQPGFQGELQIGVHGKLRNVILEAIAQ
ncbi:MAG: flagellar basal body-associated FliL family protein [Planctomycetota bacterium]|nr:flagellar basal body-associated FliL family protein [Planctomycetota bacterium]